MIYSIKRKYFATTGKALEKKIQYFKKKGLTDSQAKEMVSYRDQLAQDLRKRKNEIDSTDYYSQFNGFADKFKKKEQGEFYKKQLGNCKRNLDRIDAVGDAIRKSGKKELDFIDESITNGNNKFNNHINRINNRSVSDYIKDNAYVAKKKIEGALRRHKKSLGVGAAIASTGAAAYGAKKAYDKYKKSKEEKENKEEG